MDENILATVVVAVKSDLRVLRLIDSLLHQTFPQDRFEIIIIENGSTVLAETIKCIKCNVRYFCIPEKNMALARNIGLLEAHGKFFILTDADCVADKDWLKIMIDNLAQGIHVGIGGQIKKLVTQTCTQRYGITIVQGQTALNYLPSLALPYVAGANAGFITQALREVGGFDSRLVSGNDVDICYKLGLRGYSIGIASDAIVYHEDRMTMFQHFLRFRNYAIYQVLLFSLYKNISKKDLL